MKKPIVWTIAGSDSGGGAGIQADLHTFQALNAFGCSVITTITAQNSQAVTDVYYLPATQIAAQLAALQNDLAPTAIKLGLLGDHAALILLTDFLQNYSGKIICDPVMVSSSGQELLSAVSKQQLLENILPLAYLVTPNLPEAEIISGLAIKNPDDIVKAANKILTLGPKNVLIKGGHATDNDFCQDYWANGKEAFWLTNKKLPHSNTHGSGCTLSAAITACLAQGYDLKDALVIAKMYVTQGIRLAQQFGSGPGPVAHSSWPETFADLPYLTTDPVIATTSFASCGNTPLGLYPVVDRSTWLTKLLPLGVSTIQLRIKDLTGTALENEIITAIDLANKFNARLFINDYWQLAIKHRAYGVHLGQEDLATADIQAIKAAGLRLGISTHCYYEVAHAHALQPSYLACGPIFPTQSKLMPFLPQGISQLIRWRKTLDYPLVAIGGINLSNFSDVVATGVEGIAMISAITNASNPTASARELINLWRHQ